MLVVNTPSGLDSLSIESMGRVVSSRDIGVVVGLLLSLTRTSGLVVSLYPVLDLYLFLAL